MPRDIESCPHRNSHVVDPDGIGESLRFCNDCGANFTRANLASRDVEQQILSALESSIEDTRIPDAIAAHADKRAGKLVTKTDAEQLEAQLGVPVRIYRQHGMTHVAWTIGKVGKSGPWSDEQSILIAHADTNVRWPTGEELRKKEPAYFSARDERNRQRRAMFAEHRAWVLSREGVGEETAESAVARAAAAVVAIREATAELEALVDYDQPLHVARFVIEKLAGKE